DYVSTATAGVYDPRTKELVVVGSELNENVRVTIIHELTHALDDQHFDINGEKYEDRDDEIGFTFTAVIEGSASLVETAYVQSLTADEQRAYLEQATEAAAGVDIDAIPPILLIEQEFIYGNGAQLAFALDDAGGTDRIDEAFRDPPVTTEAVLEPDGYLADGEDTDPVPAPPADGEVIDEGVAGQFLLELLVNGRLGAGGVPEWSGDRYVVWEDGDSTCVSITYAGDAAEIEEALEDWQGRTGGSVEREDGRVVIANCT
ncbi:MAG: hypothetical protein AAGK32_05460, partial [Actinomycetota bacterium]